MTLDDEPVHSPFTGEIVLGRYHVVLPLGKGGQGMVHLARAEGAAGVARPVVIKQVLAPFANDKRTRERFIREARITARLRHPDIVSIVEFERKNDNTYLMVLEYVHGYDLWRWAHFVQSTRKEVPARLLAYVGTRVLDALHYSHSLRDPDGAATPIIHRDVSAGNVLIDVTGQIKLTDFGIAAMVAPDEPTADRTERSLQGKLGYIAHELFSGAAASASTDIYACAVMLHGLLVGASELQAPDLESAELRARTHVPTRVDRLRSDVGAAAADVIARALEKDPAARFQTAAAFSGELRRAFSLDVAEMREEFAKVIEHDFEDPLFAQKMGVLSLRQVDAAWRKQDSEVSTDSLRPTKNPLASLFPTAAAEHEIAATKPLRARNQTTERTAHVDAQLLDTRRRYEAWGWSAAVAALVALLAVVVGMRGRVSTDSRVLYVEAQPVAATTAAPVEEQGPPEPHGSAAAPSASVKPTRGKPRTADRAANMDPSSALTERFARRRPEVSRCFREHAIAQAPAKLAVAFEIDPQGKVEHAELEPHTLAATKLGACLLSISLSTRFGAQPGYMRFRIPISAQTYGERP